MLVTAPATALGAAAKPARWTPRLRGLRADPGGLASTPNPDATRITAMPQAAHPALSDHADLRRPPRCAEGDALAGGPARDALARALRQLTLAETMTGACQPAGLCQALTEVARALSTLHAYGPAESYLAQALRWAVLMGSTDTCGDLHCALAEVATNAAEGAEERNAAPAAVYFWQDRARDHAFEAAGLAGRATDPHWELKLLLRASDVLDRCGDHDDAVHLQQRALVLMGLHNPDLPTGANAPGAAAPTAWHSTAPSQLM
jgi:hypothetical protein